MLYTSSVPVTCAIPSVIALPEDISKEVATSRSARDAKVEGASVSRLSLLLPPSPPPLLLLFSTTTFGTVIPVPLFGTTIAITVRRIDSLLSLRQPLYADTVSLR